MTDTALVALSTAVAGFSEVVIRGGDLPPTPPGDVDRLSVLDRWVANQSAPNELAGTMTDLGVATMLGYGVLDGILGATLYRDRGGSWADLGLYCESVMMNWAIANVVKVAFRRPRPVLFHLEREGEVLERETDLSLSFYSLHTAFAAGITSTATYIATERFGSGWQTWVTAGVGTALTASIGVGRMLSMNHFTTDVLAGFVVGTAVGLIVPHLHRRTNDGSELSFTVVPTATASGDGGVFASLRGTM